MGIMAALILVPHFLFSQKVDYQPARFVADGDMSTQTTPSRDFKLRHCIDLRTVNDLYINGSYNESQILLDRFQEIEQLSEFLDRFKIIRYISQERAYIRHSEWTWIWDGKNHIEEVLNRSISDNAFDVSTFPPSVEIGTSDWHWNRILRNQEACDYINSRLAESHYSLGELISAENGYIAPLIPEDSENNKLILYIRKINKTIFSDIIDKYEISAIFEHDMNTPIEHFISWHGASIEKKLIYGSVATAGFFQSGDNCCSLLNKYRLRTAPNTSAGRKLGKLKKGDEFEVLSVGDYDTDEDGIGGNWLQIRTTNGTVGWFFGSPLYAYHEVDFFPEIVW